MATTGILLRRDTKTNLIIDSPVQGEMVFATDTGEHGWLDKTSVLVWKDLTEAPVGESTIYGEIIDNVYSQLGV